MRTRHTKFHISSKKSSRDTFPLIRTGCSFFTWTGTFVEKQKLSGIIYFCNYIDGADKWLCQLCFDNRSSLDLFGTISLSELFYCSRDPFFRNSNWSSNCFGFTDLAYCINIWDHGPNKCRLFWCLIEFNRLEIQSVMLVFSTPLWTSPPLTSLVHLSLLPHPSLSE